MKNNGRYLAFMLGCLVVILVVLSLAYFTFTRSDNEEGIVIQLLHPSVSAKFNNSDELDTFLRNQKVIDGENVTSVVVRIVEDIQTPTVVQIDDSGDEIITSSFFIDKNTKTATIDISPKEYVLNLPSSDKNIWIDAQFWQSSEFIMNQNTKTKRSIERIPAIIVF